MDIKYFYDENKNVMALLIPHDYHKEGITFVTKDEDYQQVAYMNHKEGHIILPHYHNHVERTIDLTSETLVIKKGVLEVTLYSNQKPIHVFNISDGDILTLLSGGHGFKVLKEVEMVEIKQGPFLGPQDKTRFQEDLL